MRRDYGFISTTSLCTTCVNRNWSTIKNRNSQTFHEEDTTESEYRDKNRKSMDMKTIANALDKIFYIVMKILTLSASVVITSLIVKSTYSEKY